ncbi:unnamed protein product [Prorocentrum cordatum]|uniref:Cyclic nucleotide-binding domain-containing protein n=1 Tax=Prorocentrum cordatum TaxID=2364126 RepID=A0ABN9VK54_9DINO|nr:unnamed protein product [Polarella glacialis]
MPMADARRQAPSPLNDLLAADARATEYGRASADEVLDGVRELLRGQRRLEQTMASLAQVPVGTPTPTEGTVKGTPSAAEDCCFLHASEGAEIWQMRSSYEQPWTPVTSGVPFQDSTCFGPLVGMGGFDSHTSENQLWLDRVEVREELVDCGSVEQLTRECSKESATLRLRSMRSPSSSNILVNFTDGSPRNQHPIRPRRWTMQHPTSPPRSIAELRHAVLKRLTWRRFSKCSVVSPASTARAWVDGLSLIVLGYNLSSIPYFLAFDVDEGSNPWVVLEGVSLVFWFVDMLMNFRTGYYEDGHLHMRPGRIARNYLRGSFFLDFFTLTALTGSLLNIGKFAAILVWINHTIACFWCFLGREDAVSDTGYTWMNLAGATGEGPTYSAYGVSYQYTTAFHWSLTQMTPGSMQVVPVNSVERIFNICCLMGGLMVFSTLVSAISASVAQLKIDMQGHSREMGRLSAFLHRSHIHPEIRMQVCKQVKVKLMHRRPLVVKDLQSPGVLDMLSLSLRHTLQLQLCNPHFLEHPLLNFCSNTDIAMWEEICMTCANFSVLVKGDNLFVFGAKAEGMYFVVHGPLLYDLDDSFRTRVSKEAETGAWLSEAL